MSTTVSKTLTYYLIQFILSYTPPPLMLSWEIYEFFRSSYPSVLWEKAVLKKICNIHRNVGGLQLYSEYCKIFKNTYFEEHLLTVTSDILKQLQNSGAAASILTLFLSSDNLLTGYEQFNRNLLICVSLGKDWFMLHKKFNQENLAT